MKKKLMKVDRNTSGSVPYNAGCGSSAGSSSDEAKRAVGIRRQRVLP